MTRNLHRHFYETHVDPDFCPFTVLSDGFVPSCAGCPGPDLGIRGGPCGEVGRWSEPFCDVNLSTEGGEDFEVVHERIAVACVGEEV